MLTERAIRDARGGEKTFILRDAKPKGLGVRVTPGGAKAFVLSYRTPAGRERRFTIGSVDALSLRDARERAARELTAIRAGESDPLERRRDAREAPTVADGVDRFLTEYAP